MQAKGGGKFSKREEKREKRRSRGRNFLLNWVFIRVMIITEYALFRLEKKK